MVTTAEFQKFQADNFTEAQFQAAVIAEAKRQGYLVYHTHDSRRSEAGYPDLHLVNAKLRVSMFRELKTMKGRPSAAQRNWLEQLRAVGHDAEIWRPIDWTTGKIARELATPPLQLPAGRGHDFTTGHLDETVAAIRDTAAAREAHVENVIYYAEGLGIQLFPWQRDALTAALNEGRVQLDLTSTRIDVKRALTRIHPR